MLRERNAPQVDMSIGQSNGGNSSIEILTSQLTLDDLETNFRIKKKKINRNGQYRVQNPGRHQNLGSCVKKILKTAWGTRDGKND